MNVKLETRLDHKEGVKALDARKVIKVITSTLALLREIEKEQTGKRPKIVWSVNVLTAFSATIIQFGSIDPNAALLRISRLDEVPTPEGATPWE